MIIEQSKNLDDVGKLLSAPHEGNDRIEDVYSRKECDYKNLSDRFTYKAKDFSKQFAHIYAVRLVQMRCIIEKPVRQKWGHSVPIRKLFQLKPDEEESCVVIGTLFKHQELKPSILREISDELQLVPQPSRTNYVSEDDELILEDELQRIRLIGSISPHYVVTGVVCAVLGHESEDGKFLVEDYCWPGLASSVERPLSSTPAEKRFLVIVSGLGLSTASDECLLALQLFVDWLGGLLGDTGEQQRVASAVRVIIAGNSIRDRNPPPVHHLTSTSRSVVDAVAATRLFDDFLVQLTSSIEVDLMPGEFDPANVMIPQQPMHYCMLPQASSYQSLHGVPNPYECELGGRRILGTSGQPVHDITRYSRLEDPLTILEQTLEWAHLAPTCPDTLSTYPYYEEDPFIISDYPDIYFAGNQPCFQTKIYEGTDNQKIRLICVPQFSKKFTCAVIDLASLDCFPVTFGGTDFSSESEVDK
ncbi:DNA polymerase delta subunit 2 [Schistocerca nitens]|uniref:DNA polymerase delta subunit 2 n=1 Tax=Schistocerca nitens TaxID=7011 RepID=UPI0021179210|nr:DNA polymerase delta subunit 2 [Schistocerca nitens]